MAFFSTLFSLPTLFSQQDHFSYFCSFSQSIGFSFPSALNGLVRKENRERKEVGSAGEGGGGITNTAIRAVAKGGRRWHEWHHEVLVGTRSSRSDSSNISVAIIIIIALYTFRLTSFQGFIYCLSKKQVLDQNFWWRKFLWVSHSFSSTPLVTHIHFCSPIPPFHLSFSQSCFPTFPIPVCYIQSVPFHAITKTGQKCLKFPQ